MEPVAYSGFSAVIQRFMTMKKAAPAPEGNWGRLDESPRDTRDLRLMLVCQFLPEVPGDEPPYWDEPVPLSDVGPPGQPFGLSQGWAPAALPVVAPPMEPPAAGPLLPVAPGVSPPYVEGPVPLNDVGPPAVPFGLPPCANAEVPDTANAKAKAIVVSFMVDSLLLDNEGGPQSWKETLR
jgi:hypothetical protein